MLRLLLICYFIIALANCKAQYFSAHAYPADYHGTKVQSGQRYSKFLSTAAHYNIPLGSKVLITEKNTGRSVVVEINDRMEEASCDFLLSEAAYNSLGLNQSKPLEVKYKILVEGKDNHSLSSGNEERDHIKRLMIEVNEVYDLEADAYYLQLGAFQSYDSALHLVKNMRKQGIAPIYIVFSQESIFRVITGKEMDRQILEEKSKQLKKKGISSIVKSGSDL